MTKADILELLLLAWVIFVLLFALNRWLSKVIRDYRAKMKEADKKKRLKIIDDILESRDRLIRRGE